MTIFNSTGLIKEFYVPTATWEWFDPNTGKFYSRHGEGLPDYINDNDNEDED